MRRLVIATRNPGKAREIAEILSEPGVPLEIASLADYPDAPEPEETGATFQENAVIKATACAEFTGELSLADDSGLEIDALNGAPGIHSARFAPTTPERNARLLELMKDVPDGSRTARFRCVVAIARPDGSVQTCEGTVEGIIARSPKGSHGFGYDPIFYLPTLHKQMAELSASEKNAISHRGKALHQAKKLLEAQGI